MGATYFELAQRRRSASCEGFETLTGALSGHAELGADHAPGRSLAMRSECGRFDPAVGFAASGCGGAELGQSVGARHDVVRSCVELVDDGLGLAREKYLSMIDPSTGD